MDTLKSAYGWVMDNKFLVLGVLASAGALVYMTQC